MARRKPSNPATIYLSRWPKSHDTYKTMYSALKRAAQALDEEDDPEKYPWHEIDYATAVELPALLQDDELAPASVNKILVAVRGVLEAAWRSGQLDDDQYRKIEIKSVKGSGKSVGRALSDEEVERFEVALEKTAPRDGAILTMMFACGMRRVGIVRSRIGDYDGVSLVSRGKGGKTATLPVVEHLRKHLDRYWDEITPGDVDDHAFGKDFTRRKVSLTVERFCKESGIARFTPHDLRRSYCTLLLKRGVPISVVSRLMSHASISTTSRYDLSGREAEIEAVKVLGRKT